MENKKTEGVGFFDGVGTMIRGELEKRRGDAKALLFDALVVIVAFLFAGCHIVFGAYPLGVALVAVMPRGVWLALIGAVTGALSLGKSGIIHAIISIIVVFLRIMISGSERRGEGALFSEPLILRISAASIGAFVGAAYEILLGGFAFKSILYGAVSVILSAAFTFAFAGILDSGITFSDFISSKRNLFDGAKEEKEKFGIYLFQATFLLFVFLVSISLKRFDIFGITTAYVFSSFITLFVARRFGPLRAMAVGFISSLGISSTYSVAFALVGLAAGILFSAGIVYALITAGLLLSFWSAYSGGSMGFLSTFPEYVIAALISAPFIKKVPTQQRCEPEIQTKSQIADDMVAATAIAYRSSEDSSVDKLLRALSSISASMRTLGVDEGVVSLEEYRNLVIDTAKGFCACCHFYDGCASENPAPCAENIDLIATKLYKKERIFCDDTTLVPKYCHNSAALFDRILCAAAELEATRFKNRRMQPLADECELFSKIISEAKEYNEKERAIDQTLSEGLGDTLERAGLHNGVIKVFGERRKHFICAADDESGKLITAKDFHEDIERIAGVRLGAPSYYRKDDVALFECSAQNRYTVEFSAVGKCSAKESVSGDTSTSFECDDGRFYALISDGMGSGEGAHKISVFAADFLSRLLNSSCSKRTAFRFLNHIIRSRGEECSATVDLFDFDLITGEAVFFKCGAAASYIKRDGSIFRIRSETAPLGLMKSIDAERIRVEVRSGDYIIMLSDGVSQSPEDATWLLELLNKPAPENVREYAESILMGAEKNSRSGDDMSVAVAKITEIQ